MVPNVCRGRILLADDEAVLRETIADALRGRGYEPALADCGGAALELGKRWQPDLSVLDINMPDMTGIDVVRRWRSAGMNFPVIMMTAEASEELRITAMTMAGGFVVKPFALKDLLDLVNRLLRGDTTTGNMDIQ